MSAYPTKEAYHRAAAFALLRRSAVALHVRDWQPASRHESKAPNIETGGPNIQFIVSRKKSFFF